MFKNCQVTGCTNNCDHPRIGYCNKHYRELRAKGIFTSINRKRGTGNIFGGYVRFRRTKFEHILVAEKALGKPLPRGAVIHHVDENKLNNKPENLVVCPSAAYHILIHKRMRALEACGNADYCKCWICKKYDHPSQLYRRSDKGSYRHPECHIQHERDRRMKALQK